MAKRWPSPGPLSPLDVGMQTGIFAKHGLEIDASAFNGDARMQQGLTSDLIDVGIGSGPGMAFMVKGVPAKAVGAMAGVPKNMAVMVGGRFADQDGRRPQGQEARRHHRRLADRLDLGKRIGTLKGWGPAGITTVPIGGMPPARGRSSKPAKSTATSARSKSATTSRRPRNGVSLPSATPFVEHFITHVFFVREENDRQAPTGREGIPPGLAGHHRVHEGQ